MLIKFEVKTELSVIQIFRLLLERLEQVNDAVRGECRLAKDAHDFDDRPANLEVVFDDSNEAVGDDGNVYLDTHCVLGLSPKSFDLKMLLDPFEKQLHLPPILVKQGDVNLRVDFNARLCASEFCPSEYGHTEINGRRVDGIEPAMQFKLLCDTLGLGNGYHMESKLLKNTVVSE